MISIWKGTHIYLYPIRKKQIYIYHCFWTFLVLSNLFLGFLVFWSLHLTFIFVSKAKCYIQGIQKPTSTSSTNPGTNIRAPTYKHVWTNICVLETLHLHPIETRENAETYIYILEMWRDRAGTYSCISIPDTFESVGPNIYLPESSDPTSRTSDICVFFFSVESDQSCLPPCKRRFWKNWCCLQ